MRVAVVSDIHGNLTALQAILPAIRKDADRVICLGDVAATGPQPHETIALMKELGYPCVMGNSDEYLWKGIRERFSGMGMPEEEVRRMQALDKWTRTQITRSDGKYLSTFKATISLGSGDSSLFCYHGSPRSNTEQILTTTSEEDLSRIFSGYASVVFAGGHTHSQMSRRWRNSVIINPGSVGLPFEKDAAGKVRNPTWAEYAMVTFEEGNLKVELRRVRYGLSKLARVVRKSGMPDPDWWLADWAD